MWHQSPKRKMACTFALSVVNSSVLWSYWPSFPIQGEPVDSYFANLYRNRHIRMHAAHDEMRSLACLTTQAEWVQVYYDEELFLEECTVEPRIERHRQGWRYNVITDDGIAVREGVSTDSR